VLDPSKRYSVDQIKRHRWMSEETPRLLPSTSGTDNKPTEPNEQILRLMQSLGIDAIKTREVTNFTFHISSNTSDDHIITTFYFLVPPQR
jgi:hypothetical protein